MKKNKGYTLQDCKDKAKEKGGECLSIEYKNNTDKLIWICEHGHQWTTSWKVILRGFWCPVCSGCKKYSIQDCMEHAESKEGKCLSTEYKNAHFKMTWECKYGHTWKTTFHNIKVSKHWCPVCSIEKRQETMLNRYGVRNISNNSYFRRKAEETNKKRYGVRFCAQNKEIALKQARKTNQPSIKFHWQTGEELICQGSYEAKVVDYLNTNQINYKWQPEIFKLSTGLTYRPDFYLVDKDIWVEIKGYMRPDAQAKWGEFVLLHPNSELWNKKKLKEMKIL